MEQPVATNKKTPLTLEERKAMVKKAAFDAQYSLEDIAPAADPDVAALQRDAASVLAAQPQEAEIPVDQITGGMPAAQPPQRVQPSAQLPSLDETPSKAALVANNIVNRVDSASAKMDDSFQQIEKVQKSAAFEADQQRRLDKIADIENKLESFDRQTRDIADKEINPERFWTSKSTYQRVMANIGLVFGTFGAALDGRNRAAEGIEAGIKEDIAAQISDRSSKLGAISQQQTLYKQMLDIYKDPAIAQRASHVSMLSAAKSTIERYSTQIHSQQAKGQALQALTAIDDIIAKQRQGAAKLYAESAGSGALGQDYTTEQANNLSPEARQNLIVLPDGKFRLALNKESTKAYNEVARDAKSAMVLTKDLNSLLLSGSKFSLEDRAKVSTNLAALVGKLRIPLTGPGILTEKEYAKLEQIIGNPNSFVTLDSVTKAKLMTLDKLLMQSMKDHAEVATGASFASADDLRNAVREKYVKAKK